MRKLIDSLNPQAKREDTLIDFFKLGILIGYTQSRFEHNRENQKFFYRCCIKELEKNVGKTIPNTSVLITEEMVDALADEKTFNKLVIPIKKQIV
jgi:hypothetical protein